MSTGNRILSIIGWGVTVILQVALGLGLVFILSLLFSGLDVSTQSGLLLSVVAVWLGFSAGIYFIGWLALKIFRSGSPQKLRARLILTALGTLIPVVVLIVMSLTIQPGGESGSASAFVESWQPRFMFLAQVFGILGFYLPGWTRTK